MKKTGLIITAVIFSLPGYSQTNQPQIEKPIQEAQRNANAGKADVIIARKKNIFDSTTLKKDTLKAVSKKRVKAGVWKKKA